MNIKVQEIVKLIEESDKIVLFHHTLPDGDSLSSSYGLMKLLQKKYPSKQIKWHADKEYLQRRFPYMNLSFEDTIDQIDESWLAIVGDVAGKERIFGFDEVYNKAGKKICFDHHRNGIDFDADIFWPEPTYPASSIQAFEIEKAFGADFDSKTAINALLGILTDTGFFKFSLNDPKPLKASAELMEFIDRDDLDNLYQSMNKRTRKSMAVENLLVGNLKTEGLVAYSHITAKDIESIEGAEADDFARPNTIGNIEGIEVWILFIEYPDRIRVEYRSLGTKVNEVAAHFGGGGHNRASGSIVELNDQQKIQEIVSYANNKANEYVKSK